MLFKLTSCKKNGIMDGKSEMGRMLSRYPFLTIDLDSKHPIGKPVSSVRS